MARLQESPTVNKDRPDAVSPAASTVPTNCTPIGSNPFVRVHTPIARLGANVPVPNAIAPKDRA